MKRQFPYYARALALGLPAYLGGVHFWAWVSMGSIFLAGAGDFRLFYTAGFFVRSGNFAQLYDFGAQQFFQASLFSPELRGKLLPMPYFHPPFEAWLFVPVSFFSLPVAYAIFLAVNVAILAYVIWVLRPLLQNLRAMYWWLPLALTFSFLSIAAALLTGQDSILLLGLVTAAALRLRGRHEFTAGLILGLCVFRPQIVLGIVLLLMLWGLWRLLYGFAVIASLCGLISLWMMKGFGYLAVLGRLSSGKWPMPMPMRFMPSLRGFFAAAGLATHPHLLMAICLVASFAILFFVLRLGREKSTFDQFLLALPFAVLISYHCFIYDLSILLLPLLIWLDRAVARQPRKSDLWLVALYLSPLLFSYASDYFFLVSVVLLGVVIAESFRQVSAEVLP